MNLYGENEKRMERGAHGPRPVARQPHGITRQAGAAMLTFVISRCPGPAGRRPRAAQVRAS
ncbi:hypothetical protein [Lysobacter gummosus]|uniref:hypothetical protein n=1 Tax=Lysobacter gummosus TaxID=262324 RepID=UPI003638EAAF